MTINWKSPWVIGGVVAVAVVVVIAGRSSAGSSGAAASTQSLISADAANVQLAGLSTSLQLNAQNQNTSTTVESLRASTALSGLWASLGLNASNNATALTSHLADVNAGITTSAMTNNATLKLLPELASIKAGNDQALASGTNATAVTLANIKADVTKTTAPELAQIAASNSQAIAQITGTTAQALATISGNTAAAIQNSKADVANNQTAASGATSAIGTIASIAGIAALAFSDARLKRDVVCVGMENGVPVYEYRFIGSSTRYRGVIAQEIETIRPEVVSRLFGVRRVDYAALGVAMREAA